MLFSHLRLLSYVQAILGGWDGCSTCACEICLEQRKQSCLTLAKENRSLLGLYWTPPTFLTSVLCCCLCSTLPLSSLITGACATPTSYVIRQNGLHVRQRKWEKSVYKVLNMDIFLTKMHRFPTGDLYSPPGAVWGLFYYGWMCFLWLLLDCKKNTRLVPFYKAWKNKDNFFLITPIGFVWKKKVICT